MNTGICTNIGRQPAAGLTPAPEYRACISLACSCLSSGDLRSLYLFCSSFILGASCAILRMEYCCRHIERSSSRRTVTTSSRTDPTQAMPASGSTTKPSAQCQNFMTSDTGAAKMCTYRECQAPSPSRRSGSDGALPPDGLGPQLHAERLPDAVTDLPRERDHVVGRGRPPVGQRQGVLGGQAGGRRRRG